MWTRPGQTALTRTPSGAASSAATFVSPTAACLDAPYAAWPGTPRMPDSGGGRDDRATRPAARRVLTEHLSQHRAQAEEDAAGVDPDRVVELLDGHVPDRHEVAAVARVVVEQVHPAERVDRACT